MPDSRGRYGPYGGRYVPETLVAPLQELERAYAEARADKTFQAELDAFEAAITAQRGEEPLPAGSLDAAHYLAIHRHIFQDIYEWAGEVRTVRISKGTSPFCYPEYIEAETGRVFAALAGMTEQRP